MKKIRSLLSRLPVIAMLVSGILAFSFTVPHRPLPYKTLKKYDRKIAGAKHISTAKHASREVYEEQFTYFSTFIDCYVMMYPYWFPDDTYYIDTDPSFITNGTHIYYDAEMNYPAPDGIYYFYHNETADFWRCDVEDGEIWRMEFCF